MTGIVLILVLAVTVEGIVQYIKSLSEILGHKNVSFTLNVYGSANLQQKVKCKMCIRDMCSTWYITWMRTDELLCCCLMVFCSVVLRKK